MTHGHSMSIVGWLLKRCLDGDSEVRIMRRWEGTFVEFKSDDVSNCRNFAIMTFSIDLMM